MPIVFGYQVAKDGIPLDQCEDAWSTNILPPTSDTPIDKLEQPQIVNIPEYFAISDGAGTAGFSGEWAKTLTFWAVNHPPQNFCDGTGWLWNSRDQIYKAWIEKIGTPIEMLPYYGQNKIAEGSQATLLLFKHNQNSFQALGIGDSILITVDSFGRFLYSWPLQKSEQFNTSPPLIHTSGEVWPEQVGGLQFFAPHAARQRQFLLATDALGKWLLEQHEKQELNPDSKAWEIAWNNIVALSNEAQFTNWVMNLLLEKEIRNDDITLVYISPKLVNTERNDSFA